jgi:mannose-6-phosphate isomerase-like protein (cupin superfamily)
VRIRKLSDCPEFVAGDGTRLRELLHPDRDYPFGGRYSLAQAIVAPGGRSARHRLSTNEVYVILAGQGLMHVDETSARLEPMDVLEIVPGSEQWIENTGEGELRFLCLVDPAWRVEDEQILE